jgi:membrane associated rhomboid family serine protease
MIPASVGFQCPECVRAGQADVRRPKRGSALRSAGRRWGPVTVTLIAVNVALFVVTGVSAALVGANPLTRNYVSPVFDELLQRSDLVDAGQWWRLVTAAFLHIGPVHLALNMLALLLFGSELERALGRGRYLAVYFVSVLGGAAAVQLFSLAPVAGASTGIWGLMGAFGVLAVARRQDLRGIATLLAVNLLISVLVPGISLIGHLGGLAGGVLATSVLVLARRNRTVQIAGIAVLVVVLLVLCLAVSTVVVL